jgi:hypothetical protein
MNFSPKNSRQTKFQSSFNDKETIDKTSSLFKSKSNIVNDIRCKDTPLKESQIIYEEIVTIGGIRAGELVSSKEIESGRKLNESINKENKELPLIEEKLEQNNNNYNEEEQTHNNSELKNPIFADATNIKCENSVYLSDNLSLLADKENIQKFLPNCNETNYIRDFGINTFDLSPILDFNSFCEKEIIINENKFNTIEVSKIENSNNRDLKYEKSQKRFKTNNSQSQKQIDTIKIKKLASNPINYKSKPNNIQTKQKNQTIKISEFNLDNINGFNRSGNKKKSYPRIAGEITPTYSNTTNNNYNSKKSLSSRKRANTKQPSNHNYITNLQPLEALSNFATIEKDKLQGNTYKFSEKNEKNHKNSVSLQKYGHVFGDVVMPGLNHNKSNKKMNLNEDADMSNFRSRLDSTQIKNPFLTNSVNGSPDRDTNREGIFKTSNKTLTDEIKNPKIN